MEYSVHVNQLIHDQMKMDKQKKYHKNGHIQLHVNIVNIPEMHNIYKSIIGQKLAKPMIIILKQALSNNKIIILKQNINDIKLRNNNNLMKYIKSNHRSD
eukprot:212971_1